MIQVSNFREVLDIRKACGKKDIDNCEHCSCPLKTKGILGITVCELVSSHINTKPQSVEIVYNCSMQDDPFGIKDFYEHCERGYIRPTSRQMDFMKQRHEKCRNCPANTRYTIQHAKLNIEISSHLCTTLKAAAKTTEDAS